MFPEDDPAFMACRDERCTRPEVHREHRIKRGPRMQKQRSHCPKCGTEVVHVRFDEQHQRAHCPSCSWRGYFTKIGKAKETESARDQP